MIEQIDAAYQSRRVALNPGNPTPYPKIGDASLVSCIRLYRDTRRDISDSSRLLHPIQRASNTPATAVQYVGVDHRRRHVLVAEQLLNGADVVAGLQ